MLFVEFVVRCYVLQWTKDSHLFRHTRWKLSAWDRHVLGVIERTYARSICQWTLNTVHDGPKSGCPLLLLKCVVWNVRSLRRLWNIKKKQNNKLCGRLSHPTPCKLTFDLLTLKVVSESRVTWATSLPILVFRGLSVLDLCPMYATDRQTSDAHQRLMPPPYGCGYIINRVWRNMNS